MRRSTLSNSSGVRNRLVKRYYQHARAHDNLDANAGLFPIENVRSTHHVDKR